MCVRVYTVIYLNYTLNLKEISRDLMSFLILKKHLFRITQNGSVSWKGTISSESLQFSL